ncbi:MAG: hypothetical protein IPK76_14455 [Lewinellaceae bacterium]|nr:hypothetical protein [Lewinellaceae bacterium]
MPTDAFTTTWKTDNPGTSNSSPSPPSHHRQRLQLRGGLGQRRRHDQSGITGSRPTVLARQVPTPSAYAAVFRVFTSTSSATAKNCWTSTNGAHCLDLMERAFVGCSNLNISAH